MCSGLDNKCISLSVFLDVVMEITLQQQKHYYPLSVRISQDSPIDIIVGRETIKRFNFVTMLPKFFFESPEIPTNVPATMCTRGIIEHIGIGVNKRTPSPLLSNSCKKPCSSAHSACTSIGDSATLRGRNSSMSSSSNQVTLAPQHAVPRRVRFNDNPLESRQEVFTPVTIVQVPAQTDCAVAATLQEPEQPLEINDFGDEEIDYNVKDMFAPFRAPKGADDPVAKITIDGSPKLQEKIKELCYVYKEIFSDKLDSRPASLTPFELHVDKSKWETFKNRCPVCLQSTVKQIEINKQVQEMLLSGIIEKSTATYYTEMV